MECGRAMGAEGRDGRELWMGEEEEEEDVDGEINVEGMHMGLGRMGTGIEMGGGWIDVMGLMVLSGVHRTANRPWQE